MILNKQLLFVKAYKPQNNYKKIQNLTKSIDVNANKNPNMIYNGVKSQIEVISSCNSVIGNLK